MRIAFCIFKFFHYGGLARDFYRIAEKCIERGHAVSVYAMEWHGEAPEHFNITMIPVRHWQNHLRVKKFIEKVEIELSLHDFDLVVGFNKMPGLDVYYAADPCYKEKTLGCSRFFYRLGGRFRYYSYCENAVFSMDSKTISLMISSVQMALFKKNYHTPDHRLLLLPPGISKDRKAPDNAVQIRSEFRAFYKVSEDERILLMVGTAFKTKGLDRSLKALSLLPDSLRKKVKLFVVGEDKIKPFKKMVEKLSLQNNVVFFGGRDDVPSFLLGADLLLQPSYHENTGTVILEAIVSGLPVLASDVCGYAFHVTQADAGKLIPSPFNINNFSQLIAEMLTSSKKESWGINGLQYAKTADLYSMPEQAVKYIEQIAERAKSDKTH